MNCGPVVSYGALLRFAKICKKRFAIPLSRAQEMLCRTFGFTGMFALQRHVDGACPARRLSFEDWSSGMRAEVGSDLDELVSEEGLRTWFRRMYRTDQGS
jgi:hypothetical protein